MKKQVFESPFGIEYVKARMDNGLSVYVMEKPRFTSSYAVFGTKYGSVDMNFSDKDGRRVDIPAGTAHFLEHKLFESEDKDAFARFAETGASANAFTSFDRTCYLFSCGDKFYENFEILLDFVQSPYFTAQTVEKEQGIIGQEIRMYDDSPYWRMLFNMLDCMYHSHPVKNDIAGTVQSISEITSETLYKCYETFYNPSNMFICVCGNVDANEVIACVEKHIKDNPAAPVTRFFDAEPETVQRQYAQDKMAVLLPMFTLGFKMKAEEKMKIKQKVCIELLLEYTAGESSPLYARMTRDGLIGDTFDFELFSGENYAAVIFDGETDYPEKVRDEILKEIENIRENGIDKKLFSAVKCQLYGDEIRRFDSVEAMCMQFAECDIGEYELFERIACLKSASAEDIYRYIDIFDESKSVLSVIKPLEG